MSNSLLYYWILLNSTTFKIVFHDISKFWIAFKLLKKYQNTIELYFHKLIWIIAIIALEEKR